MDTEASATGDGDASDGPDGTRRYRRPTRRPLRVFALDPLRIDSGLSGAVTPRTTLQVPFERLAPGPRGRRLQVIDYDGAHDCFYEPVDLDDPDLLIRDGLPPSETDPQFHQQMAYAVIASYWAATETALGRRVGFGRGPVLRVHPHAFYGENAYYDPDRSALLFGYFRADDEDAGGNLPGQMVYSCLSHDVLVHEATHALVDRLRPLFMLDTNPDVLAFHEGFADLMAIFQHFTMREVLEGAITASRGSLQNTDFLLQLARQFGYATGEGSALRSAEGTPADIARRRNSDDPHERGAVLVRSVFDAYLSFYRRRTQDLVRLATGGSGVLPDGALPPDLVGRLAREAAGIAHQFFTACLRAFDYLPPVDVTFEDFLRALVTADVSLSPSDDSLRVAIIEGFRRNGVFPSSAGSLGDRAVAFEPLARPITGVPVEAETLLHTLRDLDDPDYGGFARASGPRGAAATADAPWHRWAVRLEAFADAHRGELGFEPGHPIELEGMHPTIRVRSNGRATVDLVARFVQRRKDLDPEMVPIAGTTIVAALGAVHGTAPGEPTTTDGRVLHVISKRLPAGADGPASAAPPGAAGGGGHGHDDGAARLATMQARAEGHERTDPQLGYRYPAAADRLRVSFASLHGRDRWGDDDA